MSTLQYAILSSKLLLILNCNVCNNTQSDFDQCSNFFFVRDKNVICTFFCCILRKVDSRNNLFDNRKDGKLTPHMFLQFSSSFLLPMISKLYHHPNEKVFVSIDRETRRHAYLSIPQL